VESDWRQAELTQRERALCEFACRLTRIAADVDDTDMDGLRAVGLDDRDISDAIQVIGYFNYVTRVAGHVSTCRDPVQAVPGSIRLTRRSQPPPGEERAHRRHGE
jgi:uncharacterized peroxidase-related enzyme